MIARPIFVGYFIFARCLCDEWLVALSFRMVLGCGVAVAVDSCILVGSWITRGVFCFSGHSGGFCRLGFFEVFWFLASGCSVVISFVS